MGLSLARSGCQFSVVGRSSLATVIFQVIAEWLAFARLSLSL